MALVREEGYLFDPLSARHYRFIGGKRVYKNSPEETAAIMGRVIGTDATPEQAAQRAGAVEQAELRATHEDMHSSAFADGYGFKKRELASLILGIPESGCKWIDDLITHATKARSQYSEVKTLFPPNPIINTPEGKAAIVPNRPAVVPLGVSELYLALRDIVAVYEAMDGDLPFSDKLAGMKEAIKGAQITVKWYEKEAGISAK